MKEQLEEKQREKILKTQRPFTAKPVPDFERAHKMFQELLDRKKQSKRPTTITEFAFQESRVMKVFFRATV